MRLRALFRRRPPAAAAPEPAAAALDAALAEADRLRDAGEPARAAEAYAAALALAPDRPTLRVQLGNMLKDAGRLAEAEAAYRAALAARPGDADVRLQLGHALKLAGREREAMGAYAEALALDPGCEAARRELVAFGEAGAQSARAEAVREGRAADPAARLALRLEAVERDIAALRAELPEALALSVVPLSHYAWLRERWGPPPAPPAAPVRLLFVLDAESDPGEAAALIAALRACPGDWRLLGPARASLGPLGGQIAEDPRLRPWEAPPAAAACLDLGGWRPDWIVPLAPDARPDPALPGWIAAAAAHPARAFVTDEEEEAEPAAPGEPDALRPRLRRAPDWEGALSGELEGATAIVSRALWAERLEDGRPPREHAADRLLDAARAGALGHIPLPLLRRRAADPAAATEAAAARTRRHLAEEPGARVGPSPAAPGIVRVDWTPAAAPSLEVVICSRDNPGDLRAMVESLRATAAEPERLALRIVDNGGRDPAALALLDELAARPRIAVRRVEEPFNWSRLNNLAARESRADLLVFANDDMTMRSPAWDRRLAGQLSRAGIGVLGARLVYPEGGVQHAGVRLGWRGGAIHDGLRAAEDDPGPEGRWRRPRRVAAVTGAFLATPRALFEAVGGFDAWALPVGYGDVDYALKVRARGRAVLWDPEIELVHAESRSRGFDWRSPETEARARRERAAFRRRWGRWADADPGAHPLFADLGLPAQHLRAPSRERLLAHLARSACGAPWAIPASAGSTFPPVPEAEPEPRP